MPYLLQRIDREPVSLFSGCELKNWPQEVSALLSCQILQEIAPAHEITCRYSCDYDCDLKVRRRNQKTLLICPRHQIAPKEIAEDDVRQYMFNLPAFIQALNHANGINSEGSPHKPIDPGLYRLGTKEVESEKLICCLGLGIPQDSNLFSFLSFRALIKEGRIVVFLPAHVAIDQFHLCHLKTESVYPIVLLDTLEPGTLHMNWDKVAGLIWTEAELKEDVVLVVDTKRRLVIYKGLETTLPPMDFSLFHILAKQAGDVVPRDRIYTILWGHTAQADDPTYDRQIDDHKRKIQSHLLKLCGKKTGIAKKEINGLIVTHKKVGIQLNLSPLQVKIK